MKFNLVQPCKECPFRSDIEGYLTKGRVKEILNSIIDRQESFPCHKTTSEVETEDGESDVIVDSNSEHCAGALIFLEKLHRPNQMMRIMERCRLYDYRKLRMDSPIFATINEFIRAQRL